MLLANSNIKNNYAITVLTNDKYKNVFETFQSEIDIVSCSDSTGIVGAVFRSIICCIKYRIKYVFPLRPFSFLKLFGITPVSWIADFQHCYYPEFFESGELAKRESNYKQIAKAKTPLVLSSYDALNDFQKYYSKNKKNVFVVHFTSYITDELQKLNIQNEKKILKTYGLYRKKYAIICNQFWQHKNHIVVLKAIKMLMHKNPQLDFKFVFTGELSDRRNPEYINKIKALLDDNEVKKSVKVLGFVYRISQLCIMKYADFLIQPSLFEGWGTVVEDGKVLNKRMILSDITVHREQMDGNCILFHKNDSVDLAEKIYTLTLPDNNNTQKSSDLSFSYSKVFEQIFI